MNLLNFDGSEGIFLKKTVVNTNKQGHIIIKLAPNAGEMEGGGGIEFTSTIETNMLANGSIPYT